MRVGYATADGTATSGADYRSSSGEMVFSPGETQKVISIRVNGDTVKEPTETFFVNLTAPTGGAVLIDAQGAGTILNDD